MGTIKYNSTEAEEQSTVISWAKAMKWISVEERLPEEGTRSLVWIKDEQTSYPSVWSFDGEWDIEMWRRYVTHWMQLPPPPEGGQDD